MNKNIAGGRRVEERELPGHGTPQLGLSPTIAGSNTDRVPLSEKKFEGMGDVIVAHDEGIIYCPISKVCNHFVGR